MTRLLWFSRGTPAPRPRLGVRPRARRSRSPCSASPSAMHRAGPRLNAPRSEPSGLRPARPDLPERREHEQRARSMRAFTPPPARPHARLPYIATHDALPPVDRTLRHPRLRANPRRRLGRHAPRGVRARPSAAATPSRTIASTTTSVPASTPPKWASTRAAGTTRPRPTTASTPSAGAAARSASSTTSCSPCARWCGTVPPPPRATRGAAPSFLHCDQGGSTKPGLSGKPAHAQCPYCCHP